MRNLFNWAAAHLVAAFALALPLAAMAVTTAGYTDFGDTAGVVLWRGSEDNFHASTVIDVAEDGSLGQPYAMTADQTATSWQRFASNQSAYVSPGKVLVYDSAGTGDGYKYNPNCTFGPLSFGGMWVKTLAINGLPFSILGSGDRTTEFGASGKSTLFKFDASYTINRQGTTTFYGDATVDIAQGATFTAQAYSGQAVAVDSAATLKLKGAGTFAVTTMNVNGTLDLSETTRPSIAGNVVLGGTIVLPAGTEVSTESPFTVCSGTLSAANVNVKIGNAEAVVKRLITSGGAITALGDPVYEYTENYPTVVPAGQVYTFIGGDTAETATTASVVTVNGTLKTRGYIYLASLTTAKETMLEVVDGTATVRASATQSMSGDIKIDAGATLVNALGADALNYGWGEYIYVYGTLDMGSTRWTVGRDSRIYLYENAVITGAGQGSNGAIDITSSDVRVIAHGNSTISANMRVRASNIPIEAVEGKTLTISGLINDGVDYSQPGSITKQNSGTLVLTTAPTFTKALKLEAGTLELGGAAASASVTVAASAGTVAASSGSTLTGDLTFVAHVPSAANKALIASESFTGKVILTGDYGSSDPVSLAGLGNAVTLKDFTGFLNQGWDATSTRITIEGTFTQNNGWSGSASDVTQNAVYIAELLGDGTMTQSGAQKQSYIVGNIANFTGTFNFANSRIKSNNNAVLDKAQTVATLTVANTLTVDGGSLAGNLVASNVAVTVEGTPAVGDVLVPVSGTVSVSGTVTVNGNEVVVECVAGEGIKLASLVTINVPKVPNTTVEVSVGGNPVSPATEGESTNTYSVVSGSTVTVTYSSDDYEVTGGSFAFTASEGYTVDATAVTTAAYMASITVGETTTKYATLQAAVTAAAAVNNSKILLVGSADGMVAAIPAPASGGRVQFYIAANGNAEGTVNAPSGDYVMTTAAETIAIGNVDYPATKYTVVEAAVAVTVDQTRTLYAAMYIGDAVNAAIAGGLGSTIEFVNGTDSTPYVSTLEAAGFTVENDVWTFTTLPVAKVKHGVIETSYATLAMAFGNADNGDTITVLADNTLTGSIGVTKNLTLDLNGFTVTGAAGDSPMFNLGEVSFTITDTSEGKAGKAVSAASKVILSGSPCTFTLTAGTLESGDDVIWIYGSNGERMVNINGGKIVCNNTGWDEAYAIVNLNGTVNMTSGEIESKCSGFYVKNANISGGSVKISSESNRKVFYDTKSSDYVNVAVSGGTFNATFDEKYLVDGYEMLNNGDGTYTVRKDNGWMYAAPGHWDYTGTWSEGAALGDDKVTISDGATYSNRTASAGQLVTLDMTLSFDDANDSEEGYEDAKAAIRLGTGEAEGTYVFQLYTSESSTPTWKNATGFTPEKETDYNIVFVLDLTNKTYTASVVTDAGATTNALSVGGSTTIAFANQNNATPVQQIEFVGAGTVSSIEGSYEDAPVPEGFVENDEVTLSDGTATLTAAQATWLNQFGVKLTVAARLAELSSAQFTAAYLLNLDIMGTFSYTFNVTGFGFETVNETECAVVTVTLTRTGALQENSADKPINGTLKLTGAMQLGGQFETKTTATISDDDFSEGNTATLKLEKSGALFYKPVIE